MTPPTPQLHHVALTVSDLDTSLRWYAEVLGLIYRMDVPHEGGIGKLMTDHTWQLGIVLHRHDASTGDPFREVVVGLDHVGMAVASRDALVAWQEHLERHGVARKDRAEQPLTQSPIADEQYGSVLVFRDPDNIQLELVVPAPLPNGEPTEGDS
jgi:glyoxylase I family protein